jgi:rRNA maturation endonuclease Nob1
MTTSVKFATDELRKCEAQIAHVNELIETRRAESFYEIVTEETIERRKIYLANLQRELPTLRVQWEEAQADQAKREAEKQAYESLVPAAMRETAQLIVTKVLTGKQDIQSVFRQQKAAQEKGNAVHIAALDWVVRQLDQPQYYCRECGSFIGRSRNCDHCGGM